MTAEEVIRQRQEDWARLEQLLARGVSRSSRLAGAELMELSTLYRAAAADAARVRAAGADDGTVGYLDALLARAHNHLYRAPRTKRGAVKDFLAFGFPRAVRANARFFAWASLGFYGPFLFGLIAAIVVPEFGPAVMGPQQMEMFRHMYDQAPSEERGLGAGTMSVSYYIQHNTSIAFQCFANGVFFGLGSAFMLVYNGLVIGTVFGFLIGDDKARNILTFTSGHSAWELTAIVIAGAAGLKMGWALISTGGRTRLGSLRAAGPEITRLVGGAAFMLFVAACIEGLWSGSPIPAPVKWGFAVVQIVLVTLWLRFAGRTETEGRA